MKIKMRDDAGNWYTHDISLTPEQFYELREEYLTATKGHDGSSGGNGNTVNHRLARQILSKHYPLMSGMEIILCSCVIAMKEFDLDKCILNNNARAKIDI